MAGTATAPDAALYEHVTQAIPGQLPPAALLDLIVAADRLIAQLQAVQLGAVADFAQPGRSGNIDGLAAALLDKTDTASGTDGTLDPELVAAMLAEQAHKMAAAEVSAALHQSPLGAARRVHEALDLTEHLPATVAALRNGDIDLPRARTIAARTAALPPRLRTHVEHAVLPLASTRTPGQLTPMIDRRVIAADPHASAARARHARRDRYLDHTPAPDAMGDIRAHLPAADAVIVFDTLDAIARATTDPTGSPKRSLAARRADALTDICTQLLTDGHVHIGAVTTPHSHIQHTHIQHTHSEPETGGASAEAAADTAGRDDSGKALNLAGPAGLPAVRTHHGRPAHFNITMTYEAFLGLSQDPATLDGHGAVPAPIATTLQQAIRSLAIVLTDPQGHATAVSPHSYLPRQHLRDQVLAAAGTCRFPGCRIPGKTCDLDHLTPYQRHHPERGGPTTADNLQPQCRSHHLLKTFTAWQPHPDPDGAGHLIWTSPTGHAYLDHPAELTLPDIERPIGSATSAGPVSVCCCTEPHHDRTDPDSSTAAAIAERTRQLIEEQQRAEEQAEAQLQELHLTRHPQARWVYQIGAPIDPWPAEEPEQTDEEFNAYVDAQIATQYESFEEFQTVSRHFNKRFQPHIYQLQLAADKARRHPDPTQPPF